MRKEGPGNDILGLAILQFFFSILYFPVLPVVQLNHAEMQG